MTGIKRYPYATGNLLASPQSYFYSEYQGESFIAAWALNRSECRAELATDIASADGSSGGDGSIACSHTQKYFRRLKDLFDSRDFPAEDRKNLDAILRNFEAKKRIYQDYNPGFTSKNRTDHEDISLYVDFAFLLVAAFSRWKELPYLNALLKSLDILCAHRDMLSVSDRVRMGELVDAEKRHVDELAQGLGLKVS